MMVLSCALEMLTLSTVFAQEGPIVINQHEDMGNFGFSNFSGSLNFIYRYQQDASSNSGGSDESFVEHRFEESLSLASSAFVIHPNLVDMNLAGTFGLSQDQVTTSNTTGTFNGLEIGTIEEYAVDATILRKEIAPLTLYGHRYRELISRQFGSSIDSSVDVYGADWNIRSQTAPTQFRLYRMSISQRDATNVQSMDSTQDTFNWHTDYKPLDNQQLSFDYTFNNASQKSQNLNTTTYQSNDLTVSHSLNFGENQKNNLFSSVNFFDQTGELATRRLHLNEYLLLRHSDTFQTRYRYSLDTRQDKFSDQSTHRASVGFQQKTYKSLVTTGEAGVNIADYADQGSSFGKYGNLNFVYTKSVPYGTLSADVSFSFDQQDNAQQGNTLHISGDSRTFNDPQPIIISRSNVLVGSILITNTARSIIYTENIDYIVSYFPDHVEIRRTLGGAIADGQTVLVDYSVTSDPSNTVTTLGQGFGLRYSIEQGWLTGLAFYGRFFHQAQTIDSKDPVSFVPDEVTDITFGADYRVWKLTFNAEHQMHDSNIAPYDSTRFSARYNERISRETSIDLNASYVITNYRAQDNQTAYLLINGQAQHQLTKALYLSGGMTYRHEQDNLRGPTEAFEQRLELRWKHRQTEVYLQGRNSFITSGNEDRTSQYLMLGLRRNL